MLPAHLIMEIPIWMEYNGIVDFPMCNEIRLYTKKNILHFNWQFWEFGEQENGK